MSAQLRLLLVGLPPTTNNLYAVVAGRQVLSREGRAYHAAVRAVAQAAYRDAPLHGPVAIRINYYLSAHDRDVDGSHKALIDGLKGVLFADDRQVVLLTLEKQRVATGQLPYVSIIVRPLASTPADRTLHPAADGFALTTRLLPPSTNNTYAIAGRVRRKTRDAKAIESAYRGAFAKLAGDLPPAEGAIRLRLHYAFTADRRDVDGSHKLLLDAARGLLWVDDRQISALTLSKSRTPGEARLELTGTVSERQ